MPLYELEEGTSRKFYRIELHGNRVHLHWGRIGTEGEHQVLAHENEVAARAEYQRQLDRRTERGYRLVVDEGVPHDPDALERARLAKTGGLSTSPRFLFVHRAKRRFAWVEARNTDLMHARGPAADEATTAPTTKSCASPEAAIRERDAIVAKLMRQGYELETFGAKEQPKKRVAKQLAINEALARAIAESPFDEAQWIVLEDWILQQDDPRAEIVRLAKENQPRASEQARRDALPLLLGAKYEPLTAALRDVTWRAGHIVECTYVEPTRSADAVSACFYASPAARLLRSITFEVERLSRFAAQLSLVAKSPCARSLRTVSVGRVDDGGHTFIDAGVLAALENLSALTIRSPMSHLRGRVGLPALRDLTIVLGTRDALRSWFVQTLPGLRTLNLVIEGPFVEDLAPLFDGVMAPTLAELRIASMHSQDITKRFGETPFAKQLTVFTS